MRYRANINLKHKAGEAYSAVLSRWPVTLTVIAGVLFLLNLLVVYPGFMNTDSIKQLAQAQGVIPYYDWHPPIMAFFWSVCISVTGMVGSFVAVQLAVFWSSLYLLGLYIYKASKSRPLSLLAIVIGVLPMVLNISGAVWKDVHMAFALLLAAVLSLWLERVRRSRKARVIAGILIFSSLVYALSLRYNAILAVLPIAYMAARHYTPKLKLQLAGIVGFVIITLAFNAALFSVVRVSSSHPASAVMLDDIVHSVPTQTLRNSSLPGEFKAALIDVQKKCKKIKNIMHSYHACGNSEQQHIIQYEYQNELKATWFSMLRQNFAQYVRYRIHTFAVFLTTPGKYAYVSHSKITENDLEQSLKFPALAEVLEGYVRDFAARDFGVLYKPYLWLIMAVTILVYTIRNKLRHRLAIICLSLSATLYIIGYFPIVISGQYRYIYWAVLAVLVAVALVIIDNRKR